MNLEDQATDFAREWREVFRTRAYYEPTMEFMRSFRRARGIYGRTRTRAYWHNRLLYAQACGLTTFADVTEQWDAIEGGRLVVRGRRLLPRPDDGGRLVW